MKLLAAAKATARRCLDAAWRQQPASQQSSTAIKEQRVIVLENLIQANLSNGSFGKLAARIPSPDEDRTTAIFFPPGKGKPKGPGSQTSNSSSSSSSSNNALSSICVGSSVGFCICNETIQPSDMCAASGIRSAGV